MKKVLCVFVFCMLFSGCGSTGGSTPQEVQESQQSVAAIEKVPEDTITFGSVFEFDELEITIGTEIEWDVIEANDNYPEGADVFAIPITVKNQSDDTHGLKDFYISMYGSEGTKLSTSVSVYFDDSTFAMGDMRPGAENTAYLYCLYDGDGIYYFEFENFNAKVEVELPIGK